MAKSQKDSDVSVTVSETTSDTSKETSESTTPKAVEESTKDSSGITKRRGPGRPKGSKNTKTLLMERLSEKTYEEIEKDWLKVVKTTITQANKGDSTCLKLLWDRVIPASRAEQTKGQGISGIVINVSGTESLPKLERVYKQEEDEDDG